MITHSRQLTSPPSDLVDVTKTLHLILLYFCYVPLYFYSFHFKAKETSALIGHAALLMSPSPLSAFPFGMHHRTSSQSRLSYPVFDNVASRHLLCLDLNHLGERKLDDEVIDFLSKIAVHGPWCCRHQSLFFALHIKRLAASPSVIFQSS